MAKKRDVYAFAVLMCYTLSGTFPFAGMEEVQIITMVVVHRKRPVIPPNVDVDPQKPLFKTMIQRLWQHNPLDRSSFQDIVLQLRKHVTDPDVERSVKLVTDVVFARKFLRTLRPLFAGGKRMCKRRLAQTNV